MQTAFTADQLADPQTAASQAQIRKCVHCGFCTATCPTYVLLGDERDSPRGRIELIKAMLEAGGHASLLRGGVAYRQNHGALAPPPALAALTARVKTAFDPADILNRGRLSS